MNFMCVCMCVWLLFIYIYTEREKDRQTDRQTHARTRARAHTHTHTIHKHNKQTHARTHTHKWKKCFADYASKRVKKTKKPKYRRGKKKCCPEESTKMLYQSKYTWPKNLEKNKEKKVLPSVWQRGQNNTKRGLAAEFVRVNMCWKIVLLQIECHSKLFKWCSGSVR